MKSSGHKILCLLAVCSSSLLQAYTDPSTMTDATFFAKLNLDHPGLAAVKTAVQASNYTTAKAELLTYFRNRTTPAYFNVGTVPSNDPMTSTPDEVVSFAFEFQDGTSRNFGTDIDWDDLWGGTTTTPASGHYYMLDFAMYPVLAPGYNALAPSDPKRATYTDAWMRIAIDYITDRGNDADFVTTDNNQLDLAKRTSAWISAYSVFKNNTTLDASGNSGYLKHLWQMANALYVELENTSGNNWYISLTRSLYSAGIYFPEFKDAANWRMRAEGAGVKYMRRNVKGDGMNIEPTENYHAYGLSLADTMQGLAVLNGTSVLTDLDELFERGGEILMDLSLPNFDFPMIGDSGHLHLDVSHVMSDYASIYGRSDFLYIATKGAQGTVPVHRSVLHPNSFGIMRTGWGVNDKYLVIENEDTNYTGSHNHPDDLSLMMYAYGKRLIVDPGVGKYDDADPGSNWLRNTTQAHNTVEANGFVQSNIDRKVVKWHSNDGFDFYHGKHRDYAPIQHDRKVFFAKPDFWIVSDLLTGSTISNAYKQYWHFMPTTVALNGTTKTASTSFSGEANVKVVPADPTSLTATAPTNGYYSEQQNIVVSNVQYLSYAKTATGSTTFDTVLYPMAAGVNKNVILTRLTTTPSAASTVASALKIEQDQGNSGPVGFYYLSHETTPGTRTFDTYNYNGEVAYVEKTSAGALRKASMIRGTLLKDGATNLINANATVQNLSVSYNGATLDLYSSDVLTPTITLYAPGVSTVRLNGSAIGFTPSGSNVIVGGATIPSSGTTNVLTDAFSLTGLTSQTWDFESGAATGLTPLSGTWSVQTSGGTKVYRQSDSAAVEAKAMTSSKWTNVLAQADVTTNTSSGSYNGVGLFLRYQDGLNNYHFRYYTNGGSPQLRIDKNFNGTGTTLASTAFTMNNGQKYTLKAVASANTLKFFVDGVLKLTAYDTDVYQGYAGLCAHRRDAFFDNVKVTEVVNGSQWDIGQGYFLINNSELYADSLTEADSEVRSRTQNSLDDYVGQANVKVLAWGTGPSRAGITARSLSGNSGYRFIAYKNGASTTLRIEKVLVGQPGIVATPTVLAETAYTINTGTYYTFKAVVNGGVLKFFVNGVEQLSAYDTNLWRGGFGLHAGKAQVRFDDVSVDL